MDSFLQKVVKTVKRAGPAFISTTTVFGPASLLLAGVAGARFGYKCAWVLWLILIERGIFMDIGTRLGVKMKKGFFAYTREKKGPVLGIIAALTGAIPLFIYTAGNTLGTALAGQLIIGKGNLLIYGIFFMLLVIGLRYMKNSYSIIEKVSMFFMLVMFLAFGITLCITGINWGAFFRGLIPSFEAGPLAATLGMFLTNCSQQGVHHSTSVAEKNYTDEEAKGDAKTDHLLSTVFVVLIIGMIMATAAETLGKNNEVPSSAPEFARMLEPLAGAAAKYIFGIGLFGSAITSLIGAPTLAGVTIVQGFGIKGKDGFNNNVAKIITTVTILVMGLWGLLPVVAGWTAPLNIYTIASLMTFLSMPICGVLVLMYLNDSELMGDLKYKKGTYWFSVVLFAIVMIYCTYNFITSYIIK